MDGSEDMVVTAESFIRSGNLQAGLNDLNTLLSSCWKAGTYSAFQNIPLQDALDTVLEKKRIAGEGIKMGGYKAYDA